MPKTAPSPARLAAMVGFALSCFGLLLFLWLSFGGPVPLKPKGYRFQVSFPDAGQLATQVDVRISGVRVGKVVDKGVDPASNRTLATLEIDRAYAPVPSDTRAVLRRKTLVGETYVELTPGSRTVRYLEEGERLSDANVQDAVDLDEILDIFDPYTRKMFRIWQQELGRGVRPRGQEINDGLGNLPAFVDSGGNLFETLDAGREDLGDMVREIGVVFDALSANEGRLQRLVTAQDDVFSAIQSERESFADVFQVFPTFLRESRQTFRRMERFADDAEPLLVELEPAMRDLRITLPRLAELAPSLEAYFARSGPLLDVAERSLPATREVLDGFRGVLRELGPFLGQLNPILEMVNLHIWTLSDLTGNLGVATGAKVPTAGPGQVGHYLRQFGVSGAETVAIHPNRLASNRGNAYLPPLATMTNRPDAKVLPNFDCKHVGGEKAPDNTPGCRVMEANGHFHPSTDTKYPQLRENLYEEGDR